MAPLKKNLREYIVAPDFNFAAARSKLLPGLPQQDVIAAMNAQEKAALDAIRKPVSDIVAADGGKVIVDGSNFAVDKHPEQYASFMLVQVEAKTAAKIAQLPGVLVGPNSRLTPS